MAYIMNHAPRVPSLSISPPIPFPPTSIVQTIVPILSRYQVYWKENYMEVLALIVYTRAYAENERNSSST